MLRNEKKIICDRIEVKKCASSSHISSMSLNHVKPGGIQTNEDFQFDTITSRSLTAAERRVESKLAQARRREELENRKKLQPLRPLSEKAESMPLPQLKIQILEPVSKVFRPFFDRNDSSFSTLSHSNSIQEVEEFDRASRERQQALHQLEKIEIAFRPFFDRNHSVVSNLSNSKQELVRSRREKQQELEQLEKIEKYNMHHTNRRKSSAVRHFETSRKQRFLLQAILTCNFIVRLLSHKAAQATTAKTFQRLQLLRMKAEKAKEWVAQLEAKRKDKRTRAQINRLLLFFFVKCRLKRRIAAASLLENYFKISCFEKWNLKVAFLKFRRAIRIVQRNVRGLKSCGEARLLALKMKLAKVFSLVKNKEGKRSKRHSEDVFSREMHSLKQQLNFDITLDGDAQNTVITAYIAKKRKEWISQVDRKRNEAHTLQLNIVREWLVGELPMEAASNSFAAAAVKLQQQFPFSPFLMYKRTTYKVTLELIVAIQVAKCQSMPVLRRLRQRDVSNVSFSSKKDICMVTY